MNAWILLVLISVLTVSGCAGPRPELAKSTPPTSVKTDDQAQVTEVPPDDTRPTDEEDGLLYRLLAAPEYLWKGITYPIKKMSIFYEQVDLLERALDFFLNEERTGGVVPRFEFGGAIGAGVGLTAFHNNLFNKNKQIRASYLFGLRNNQAGEFSYKDPAFLGSPYKLEVNLLGLDVDRGRFFPGGNRAPKDRDGGQTNFELDEISGDVKVGRPVVSALSAFFLGRAFYADAKEGKGRDIPATIPGVGSSLTAIEGGPQVTYDSRDSPFRPSTGWLIDATFSYTNQVDGDQFEYIGYTAEIQRYFSVFRGNRVLLLRAYLAKLDSLKDRSIPFYELNQLDLNHGLRGYERGRFFDEGALLFNAEWRYPVWAQTEGSIFVDAGQVFNEYRDLNTRTFRISVGTGFRFVTKQKFAFRVQVAGSEDGLQLLLKGDVEFQRKRGTFLGGF